MTNGKRYMSVGERKSTGRCRRYRVKKARRHCASRVPRQQKRCVRHTHRYTCRCAAPSALLKKSRFRVPVSITRSGDRTHTSISSAMLDAAAISSAARAGWGGAERNGLHSLAKIPNRFYPRQKVGPPQHAAHSRCGHTPRTHASRARLDQERQVGRGV